jgi:hypothetical protein
MNNGDTGNILDINPLSSFEGTNPSIEYSSGDYGEEVTPVPMPNTEVKLFSADGSWGISPCESRTSPGKCEETALLGSCFFVFVG